ncbi:hypothetical protein RN001_009044 [Aquatica leii]|uniref:Uncharacterized protein n=1 Tax=Aquatica leii TaxID=1421715 RepID=A0AAN7SMP5_9COLE|nr:hypothetical protein RN001_009044 [Aquatica leii]
MFKLFVFACILAFVAAEAKPSFVAAPLAYSTPLAYSSSYAYANPLAYSAYAPAYYKNYYSAPLSYAYGSYYY